MGLKDNNFVELKGGDRITLRNGDVLTYDEYYDKITNAEDSRLNYKENLLHKSRRELDIVEIKRPVEYKTIFTDTDRTEDEELDVEDVIDTVRDSLEGKSLTKGTTIVINL